MHGVNRFESFKSKLVVVQSHVLAVLVPCLSPVIIRVVPGLNAGCTGDAPSHSHI
jgi:hypothetical protein